MNIFKAMYLIARTVEFTSDEKDLKKAKFIIVAVPTPVNTDHTPNLKPVIGASEIIGRNLVPDSIIVYESTVYPGCTEDICIPILEQKSGLKCGVDYKAIFSPFKSKPITRIPFLAKASAIGIPTYPKPTSAIFSCPLIIFSYKDIFFPLLNQSAFCDASSRNIMI